QQPVEDVFLEGAIDVAPADLRVRGRLADNETVARRASGAVAGVGVESTAVGEHPFAANERFLDQKRRSQIGEDAAAVKQTMLAQVEAHGHGGVLTHHSLLCGAWDMAKEHYSGQCSRRDLASFGRKNGRARGYLSKTKQT